MPQFHEMTSDERFKELFLKVEHMRFWQKAYQSMGHPTTMIEKDNKDEALWRSNEAESDVDKFMQNAKDAQSKLSI